LELEFESVLETEFESEELDALELIEGLELALELEAEALELEAEALELEAEALELEAEALELETDALELEADALVDWVGSFFSSFATTNSTQQR